MSIAGLFPFVPLIKKNKSLRFFADRVSLFQFRPDRGFVHRPRTKRYYRGQQMSDGVSIVPDDFLIPLTPEIPFSASVPRSLPRSKISLIACDGRLRIRPGLRSRSFLGYAHHESENYLTANTRHKIHNVRVAYVRCARRLRSHSPEYDILKQTPFYFTI